MGQLLELRATIMTTDSEYVKIADKAWHEALEIAKSTDGWKVEKEDKDLGDTVESKKNSAGRKIYRCKGTINIPPKLLIEALTDTDKVTTWNLTLTEAKTLKKISNTVSISYQVTSDGGGGLVSARDFIYVSMQGYDGRTFVMGLQCGFQGWACEQGYCEGCQRTWVSNGNPCK